MNWDESAGSRIYGTRKTYFALSVVGFSSLSPIAYATADITENIIGGDSLPSPMTHCCYLRVAS
ncbi:hypothetical protein HCA61_12920 [Rhodococcus sp. HNM0563]|uniref:hypothetical protein n=1 Tax=Rhodococcus sp. HNM0563 TaxID=2716339 RepID=UPI00146CCA4D|nr:hypothetical protein [Rhodococcus sp. HNM0563]NLU63159.1 hypothetical protein [Rhodococcus sp. HNM0563]